jgi:hypothetical protein
MSHDPKQYEELLIEIVRQRARSLRRPEWEAAGNLLVSIGSKHLAKVVLRDLVVQITVGVRDPKAADAGASVRNPESVARRGRGWSLPKGYPRYTLYELVDDERLAEFRREPQFVDKERLAGGPSKIWFVRHSKHWPKRIAPRQARSSADDHHVRIDWLAGLLGAKPKSLALQLRPRKSLEWSGDETFVRAVQRMVQEAEGHHRAVINRLIRQDRLEQGSRKELKLRTQVYVHDARRKPSQLPSVPGVRLRPIR